MACGSEEYSCTSMTPQSSDALSFFSLEADGATLKRPCRMHAGIKQAITCHQGTSETNLTGQTNAAKLGRARFIGDGAFRFSYLNSNQPFFFSNRKTPS